MARLSTNTSYVQVRISYWIVIATLTFLAFWVFIKDRHKCIWDLSTFQGFIWLLTWLYFDITRAIFHAILTLGFFVTEINFTSFGIEPWVNNHIHINWIVITKFNNIWLGQRWNRQVDKWHPPHNIMDVINDPCFTRYQTMLVIRARDGCCLKCFVEMVMFQVYFCPYLMLKYIQVRHDKGNDNNNEITCIAKWHTNHVQKVMIKQNE